MRKAADIACRALHKATTRACDSSTMDKTGGLNNVLYVHIYMTFDISIPDLTELSVIFSHTGAESKVMLLLLLHSMFGSCGWGLGTRLGTGLGGRTWEQGYDLPSCISRSTSG